MVMAQVLTLSDFLLARIAEDKAVARDVHHRDCRIYVSLTIADCSCAAPARVLAECVAKHRIVEAADGPERDRRDPFEWDHAFDFVLLQMGAVYADHPDYRDEWRP